MLHSQTGVSRSLAIVVAALIVTIVSGCTSQNPTVLMEDQPVALKAPGDEPSSPMQAQANRQEPRPGPEAAATGQGANVTQRYEAHWSAGAASELCTTYVGFGVSDLIWQLYFQHGDGVTHDAFEIAPQTQGMTYRVVAKDQLPIGYAGGGQVRLDFFRDDGFRIYRFGGGGTVGTVPQGAVKAALWSCVSGPMEVTYDVFPAAQVKVDVRDGTLPTNASDGCPGTTGAGTGAEETGLGFDVPSSLDDGSPAKPVRASFHFDSLLPARARLIVTDQDGAFLAEAYDEVVAWLPPNITRLTLNVDACPLSGGPFRVVGMIDLERSSG